MSGYSILIYYYYVLRETHDTSIRDMRISLLKVVLSPPPSLLKVVLSSPLSFSCGSVRVCPPLPCGLVSVYVEMSLEDFDNGACCSFVQRVVVLTHTHTLTYALLSLPRTHPVFLSHPLSKSTHTPSIPPSLSGFPIQFLSAK